MERLGETNNQHSSWRRRFYATLAGGLLFGGMFGTTGDTRPADTYELELPDQSSDIGETMVVMTANVHGWEDPEGGNNFDEFVSVIESYEPDVVCMQEVIGDGGELSRLHTEYDYNVLFAATTTHYRVREGNAVISKAPIDFVEVTDLPINRTEVRRRTLDFVVETKESQQIYFSNLHLSYNPIESEHQINFLLNRQKPKAVENVCGDTNGVDDQAILRLIGAKSTDVGRATIGFTFPNDKPSFRLDTVWTGCGQILDQSIRREDIGSDHRAVLVDLDIRGCINTRIP